MEALGNAVVLGEAPHAGAGLLPVEQGPGECLQRFEIGVLKLADVPVKDFGAFRCFRGYKIRGYKNP